MCTLLENQMRDHIKKKSTTAWERYSQATYCSHDNDPQNTVKGDTYQIKAENEKMNLIATKPNEGRQLL